MVRKHDEISISTNSPVNATLVNHHQSQNFELKLGFTNGCHTNLEAMIQIFLFVSSKKSTECGDSKVIHSKSSYNQIVMLNYDSQRLTIIKGASRDYQR